MWQRFIVVIDLVLLWILWPRIARGEATGLGWRDFKRASVRAWLVVSFLPVLLVVTIATFPGEWLEESLPPERLIPTTWEAWTLPSVEAIEAPGSGWVTLDEPLVGRPQSLWPNVLVLLNFEVGDRAKVDTEGKIAISLSTISLSDRSLERAVLTFAHLRKANFTGVSLAGADFGGPTCARRSLNAARSRASKGNVHSFRAPISSARSCRAPRSSARSYRAPGWATRGSRAPTSMKRSYRAPTSTTRGSRAPTSMSAATGRQPPSSAASGRLALSCLRLENHSNIRRNWRVRRRTRAWAEIFRARLPWSPTLRLVGNVLRCVEIADRELGSSGGSA